LVALRVLLLTLALGRPEGHQRHQSNQHGHQSQQPKQPLPHTHTSSVMTPPLIEGKPSNPSTPSSRREQPRDTHTPAESSTEPIAHTPDSTPHRSTGGPEPERPSSQCPSRPSDRAPRHPDSSTRQYGREQASQGTPQDVGEPESPTPPTRPRRHTATRSTASLPA